MEEHTTEQISKKTEIEESNNMQAKETDGTAIVEYLDVVKSEYGIERNKKQSFENRVGFIMAYIGTICIFLFEKVKLQEIVKTKAESLNFYGLIKIISGLSVYVCFIFTITMLFLTIIVKKHDNFEVKSIDESLLAERRRAALCRLIFVYRDIIVQHRELNEKRAVAFRRSLYGIFATFVSIIIYISFG